MASSTQPLALVAIRAAGALTLVGTMALVTLSALGRHVGLPLPGTVEIVELLILVTAAAGILVATVERGHAAARLFIDHLTPAFRNIVERAGVLIGALFCIGLTVGNAWLLYDVWTMHEASHLLGIPIVPFRILFVLTLVCTSALLLRQLFQKPELPTTGFRKTE